MRLYRIHGLGCCRPLPRVGTANRWPYLHGFGQIRKDLEEITKEVLTKTSNARGAIVIQDALIVRTTLGDHSEH